MNDRMRKLLRFLLLVVGVGSLLIFLWQQVQNFQGKNTYDQALVIAQSGQKDPSPIQENLVSETAPAPEHVPVYSWIPAPIGEDENLDKLTSIDIRALQEVNPDVIGWICIPNTRINYPILQGEDNDFYLKHTWEKQPNVVGSVFMEYQNSPDFKNFNTILYAHNMNDGSMFADVSKYADQWYYDQHPYIYIVLPDEIWRYEAFSCYKAPVDSVAYGLSFRQQETREEFIAFALEQALVDTGIQPVISDRILTLSTCTGSGYEARWVVHARMPMLRITK